MLEPTIVVARKSVDAPPASRLNVGTETTGTAAALDASTRILSRQRVIILSISLLAIVGLFYLSVVACGKSCDIRMDCENNMRCRPGHHSCLLNEGTRPHDYEAATARNRYSQGPYQRIAFDPGLPNTLCQRHRSV